ncbi:hypothetical protein GRI40_02450 [Altererythrobacter aerius]|uniref:TadE-like domain-containing protein n=1 Tax=Tsuneonella aeria TaxID=1837929 RepID=A0A6I4T9T4_9SPHN|nr:TadE/TadG family type IV pilus assembly protein [Tsuneonella aeria]MXO74081.1 hypothetical protein [Tsuneonella aeria]
MRAVFPSLIRDRSGASLVEFAMIFPVLISMLLGAVQTGFWMQNYNAVRNITNDVARFAMVEYQRGNKITNDSIATKADTLAAGAKYQLGAGTFVPKVTDKPTQVDGVRQLRLDIAYTPPEFMPFVDPAILTIRYGRDIYLYDANVKAVTP